jgi:6-phosphogluconolactonase
MNEPRQVLRWHIYRDSEQLFSNLASLIVQVAHRAVEQRGVYHVVLAGGRSPIPIYRRLVQSGSDVRAWHLYYGDERCYPRGMPGRNDTRINEIWLSHPQMRREQIHSIPAELGPEEGAQAYQTLVSPIDLFDCVLLGLGEDGHTASLFPGLDNGGLEGSPAVIPVQRAPKPPPQRVTLSANKLGCSRNVYFLVVGREKHAAVVRWKRGEDIPAASIRPAGGLDIFLDESAWEES